MQAYNEAKLEIERAINATINNLFAQRHDKSPTFLMRFFRYPDEVSRNLVKSADIYARTLNNVRKNIAAGLKLNLTDGEREVANGEYGILVCIRVITYVFASCRFLLHGRINLYSVGIGSQHIWLRFSPTHCKLF